MAWQQIAVPETKADSEFHQEVMVDAFAREAALERFRA